MKGISNNPGYALKFPGCRRARNEEKVGLIESFYHLVQTVLRSVEEKRTLA